MQNKNTESLMKNKALKTVLAFRNFETLDEQIERVNRAGRKLFPERFEASNNLKLNYYAD
jgi:hypothetical protein